MPTPTEPRSDWAGILSTNSISFSSSLFIALLTLVLAGCQREPANGFSREVGNLKVGGTAKLVSFDGSDIILDPYVASASGKAASRAAKSGKVERVKIPAGTAVLIKAIVGDDAQIEIKEGTNSGSQFWVECVRLEPVSP